MESTATTSSNEASGASNSGALNSGVSSSGALNNDLRELTDSQALQSMGYSGDVTALQSYDYLCTHEDAAIIDVRTTPEWQFIGVPDLHAANKSLGLVSWKIYPDFHQNPQFAEQLADCVSDKQTPIFFLCRSGGRSLDAAIYATRLGYRCCFNIAGGFEGDPNSQGQRGKKEGWKASGLPWQQT